MTKDGCTVARSDFYPVARERHCFRGQVKAVQWDDLLADNHPRRRSVVSNGIRKFDLPLCAPAVNELERRADAACCCQDGIDGGTWPLSVFGKPASDLRLDAR